MRNRLFGIFVCAFMTFGAITNASAAPVPVTAKQIVYRGAFVLPATNNIGKGAALAYAPSRGTWFVLDNRFFDFALLEINLPDDAAYPGGPQAPTFDQKTAPVAKLARNWGTGLSTNFGGPIDPTQNDVFGAYWDDATNRLYVSFGDY